MKDYLAEAIDFFDARYTGNKIEIDHGKTLAAAYREKREECDLWEKSEKECNEAYKKLSDALRDQFAMAALQATGKDIRRYEHPSNYALIAEACYAVADAMIKERDK